MGVRICIPTLETFLSLIAIFLCLQNLNLYFSGIFYRFTSRNWQIKTILVIALWSDTLKCATKNIFY